MARGRKGHQFTADHLEEVRGLQKEIKDAKLYRKLDVLRLRMEGYRNAEVARITGYSASRVSTLAGIYVKKGLDYFRQENRKSGNRYNLTFEEEAELLSGFREAAERGVMVSVQEIREAYQAKCDHPVAKGTIYTVLKRHDWRKVMPRSRHPRKASEAEIEASKKLTSACRK